MKKLVILIAIFTFVLSLNAAYAADRKSEDAKEPMDTFLFQPFWTIDKAMQPPDNYKEQFHTTIEDSMQADHLEAKEKAGRI